MCSWGSVSGLFYHVICQDRAASNSAHRFHNCQNARFGFALNTHSCSRPAADDWMYSPGHKSTSGLLHYSTLQHCMPFPDITAVQFSIPVGITHQSCRVKVTAGYYICFDQRFGAAKGAGSRLQSSFQEFGVNSGNFFAQTVQMLC